MTHKQKQYFRRKLVRLLGPCDNAYEVMLLIHEANSLGIREGVTDTMNEINAEKQKKLSAEENVLKRLFTRDNAEQLP